MSLQGASQFKARLKALRTAFKPYARAVGDTAVPLMRSRIPVRTGKTRNSVRVRNSTERKMTIVANFPAIFIDKGTKAHDEKPRRFKAIKFEGGNGPVFTKKVHHPRTAAKPFAARSMTEAVRKHPMADELIKAWNAAA